MSETKDNGWNMRPMRALKPLAPDKAAPADEIMASLNIPPEEREDCLDTLAALAEVALEAYFEIEREKKASERGGRRGVALLGMWEIALAVLAKRIVQSLTPRRLSAMVADRSKRALAAPLRLRAPCPS